MTPVALRLLHALPIALLLPAAGPALAAEDPAAADPPQPVQAPPPPPPAEVEDDGEWNVMPHLRVAMGPVFDLPPGGPTDTAFTLDVLAAVHFLNGSESESSWGGWAELGYTYDDGDAWGGNRLVVGLGPMWNRNIVGITLVPRFVWGSLGTTDAPGIRYGIAAHLLYGMFSVELEHEVLFPADDSFAGPLQEVRLVIGIDVIVVVAAFYIFEAIGELF